MSIFSKPGLRNENLKCPNCGERLVPEEMAGGDEAIKKMAFDGAYQTFFLVRGERFVCLNCKKKRMVPYKFKKNLLGQIIDNHFLDAAMRKTRKK